MKAKKFYTPKHHGKFAGIKYSIPEKWSSLIDTLNSHQDAAQAANTQKLNRDLKPTSGKAWIKISKPSRSPTPPALNRFEFS